MPTQGDGLRGVVVGESTICDVHPEGNLFYRGYNIHDLADYATFEEIVYLLWEGELPNRPQLEDFRRELGENYAIPDELTALLAGFPKDASPMDGLRTAVSALGMYDPEPHDNSAEACRRKSLRLVAKTPTLVAYIERFRDNLPLVPPCADMPVAANFLRMLTGKTPEELDIRTLDVDFTLHADHEFNASTFAARVTVGTLADLYSGAVSGLGALSGPRHGAAAEETMQMLLHIGSLDKIEDYVIPRLTGEKRTPIPGFGHAVYRAPDPRAENLRQMSFKLGELHNAPLWYQMTTKIETLVDELSNTPERLAAGKQAIYANVDCFSGACYYTMGLPIRLYTSLFAISRMAGWCTHMMEQLKPGQRIIRPRSEYVGPIDKEWVPIEQRP